jgi:hypothetical protein
MGWPIAFVKIKRRVAPRRGLQNKKGGTVQGAAQQVSDGNRRSNENRP